MSSRTVNIDDFGMFECSNARILALAEQQKINSISCFVDGAGFSKQEILRLQSLENLKIGIHLDLTEFHGKSIVNILNDLLQRKITHTKILMEFTRQIELFIKIFGTFPSHIDSHQHVHQLPVIRSATKELICNYKDRFCPGFYIRNTDVPFFFILRNFVFSDLKTVSKNLLLKVLGVSFKGFLKTSNIPTNRYLLGTYSFESGLPYSKILDVFLRFKYSKKDVFYCHPGSDTIPNDSISENRAEEFMALMQ